MHGASAETGDLMAGIGCCIMVQQLDPVLLAGQPLQRFFNQTKTKETDGTLAHRLGFDLPQMVELTATHLNGNGIAFGLHADLFKGADIAQRIRQQGAGLIGAKACRPIRKQLGTAVVAHVTHGGMSAHLAEHIGQTGGYTSENYIAGINRHTCLHTESFLETGYSGQLLINIAVCLLPNNILTPVGQANAAKLDLHANSAAVSEW